MKDKKMLTPQSPSTYEKIIPFKKLPYWLVYLILGVGFFTFSDWLLTMYGEGASLAIKLFMAFVIGWVPIALVQSSQVFIARMNDLSTLLWPDAAEFEKWLTTRHTQIFTLETQRARIASLGIFVAIMLTIALLGSPYKNQSLSAIAFIGFFPVAFIFGHGAYVCAELLFTLAELVKRPVQVPFFRLPHAAISGLYSDFSSFAIGITIAYTLLFWSAWESPYHLNASISVWLGILACYPLAMFFWSLIQVHLLMQRVKQSHLEVISRQIQVALQKVTETQETQAYDLLTKAIEIQNKVQNLPEWPLSISGTLTFFITTVTALIQITLSLRQLLKP